MEEHLALSWVQVMPLDTLWWVLRAAGATFLLGVWRRESMGQKWGLEGGGAGDKLGHGKGPTRPMLARGDGRG